MGMAVGVQNQWNLNQHLKIRQVPLKAGCRQRLASNSRIYVFAIKMQPDVTQKQCRFEGSLYLVVIQV